MLCNLRFNPKSFLATALLCFCSGQAARADFDPVNDDTDIFLANPNIDANRPNVLIFIDNTANWNNAFTNEKAALVSVISNLGEEFNVGTMLFPETGNPNDNVDGGNVRFAIRQMTDTNKSVLANIYNSFHIQNDKGNNATPALGMLEAYRYFSGGYSRATHGKIKSDYTGNATHETVTPSDLGQHALPSNPSASSRFNTPIADACQDNFIIYISNGPANENASALAVSEDELASLGYDTSSTIAITPNGQEGNWMDEWADYLATADVNSNFDGDQHVYTYVVEVDPGTTGQGPAMTALLKSAAAKGKGEYFAVTSGSSGTAIVDALNDIFSEIQAVNSVFASTTLPVSVNVRGTNLNQVYIGVFRPDETKSPRWYGNLKMYKLGFDSTTNTLFLQDADGADAENPATGFINPTAESFWTAGSSFWAYRDDDLNGEGGDSDLPDGDLVEKGGAAQQLREDYVSSQSSRKLYTCNEKSDLTCGTGPGESPDLSDFPFSTANDGISEADLELATIAVSSLSAAEEQTISSLTDSLAVSALNTSPVGGSVSITLDVGTLNSKTTSAITTQETKTITAINSGLSTKSFVSLNRVSNNQKVAAAEVTAHDFGSSGTTATVRVTGVTDNDYNGVHTINITGANNFNYTPTGSNLGNLNASAYASATVSKSTTNNTVTITSAGHGLSVGDSIAVSGIVPTEYNGNYSVNSVSGNDFTIVTATTLSPITSIASAQFSKFTTTARVTTSADHGFADGSYVRITSVTPTQYNGTFQITVTGSNTFTYNVGAELANATVQGTAAQDADNTVTATVTAPSVAHAFGHGSTVNISGGSPGGFNGAFTISNPGASTTTFTYTTATKLPPNTGSSVSASSGFSTTARLSITDHGLYPFMDDVTGKVTIRVAGVSGVDGGTGDATDYTNNGADITATIEDDNTLSYTTANNNAPGPALGTVTARVKHPTSGKFIAFATVTGHGYGNGADKGSDDTWNTSDDVAGDTVTLSVQDAANTNYNLTNVTATVKDSNTFYYPLDASATLGADTGDPVASRNTTDATARAVAHGFLVGDSVEINGANPTDFNDTWTVVSVPDTDTFTFDLTENGVSAQGDATGTITASTGAAATGELANIINWVRGADNFEDENTDSDDTDIRASIHGDVLHSRPAIVNYNRHGNDDDVYVFYGGNDGVFRAVKGGFDQSDPSEPDPGHEAWGFIPTEFFGDLKRLRNNEPTISSYNKKPYFADGSVAVLSEDNSGPAGAGRPDDKLDVTVDNNSNPDRVYLYITMRRGGRLIYALDVSDPADPKFLWKIDNTTAGFSELGQTWSVPKVTTVAAHDNPVLIFGAGYDPDVEDIDPADITAVNLSNGAITANGVTVPRSMGRGIFVVDAYTGELLWQAGRPGADPGTGHPYVEVDDMIYAIPSDITVIGNRTGSSGDDDDRAYVGDTGGNVWRIDMSDDDFDDWTVTKLADVVPDDAPSCTAPCDPITIPDDLRKFQHAPDVVYGEADSVYTSGYDAVLLGSGDREHPFDEDVINRFYMFKDIGVGTRPLIDTTVDDDSGTTTVSTNDDTLAEGNLFDATSDCVEAAAACANVSDLINTSFFDSDDIAAVTGGSTTATSAIAEELLTLAAGWYITLSEGEKVTGNAVTLNKITFFNTNQPSSTADASNCSSNLGIARQYQVVFSDATAYEDKLGGTEGEDALDRASIHAGGGYLPAPVPLVVEIEGEIHEGVISGVRVDQPPGSLLNARLRKFWYREMD
jgi:Tfp pilus tip-associated adhesin PilY1